MNTAERSASAKNVMEMRRYEPGKPVPRFERQLKDIIPAFSDSAVPVMCGAVKHPRVPEWTKKYQYQPRRELFRELLGFSRASKVAFTVKGESGSGKSTVVEEWHRYINVPLYKSVASKDHTVQDFIGGIFPHENGFKWVDGPLIRAYREGGSFFIDEYNLLQDGTKNALNDALEGKPILIESTGELVEADPYFKFYMGLNPDKGLGLYSGRSGRDIANDDRSWHMHVPYAERAVEVAIVKEILSEFSDDKFVDTIAGKMVDVATEIRSQFVGGGNAAATLDAVLTTRGLADWGERMVLFRNTTDMSPVQYALIGCFLNREMEPQTREGINSICEMKLGQDVWDAKKTPAI